MHEKLIVDISGKSSTKEFIDLIEKLNGKQTVKFLIKRSKHDSNIITIETDKIDSPSKFRKKRNYKKDEGILKGKNGQVSIVMTK